MTSTIPRESYPPHVMVQFDDGAHSFLLPAGATLMDLAERIDDLTALHDCAPIAIHVDFDTFGQSRSMETRSHRDCH